MPEKLQKKQGNIITQKSVSYSKQVIKNINDISYISYDKRITYMPKIIQAAVTKLINNELLIKYHKIVNSLFNSTTSIDPYKFH